MTISCWRDPDAMAAIYPDGAADIRRVHHLPRDPGFLLELPEYSEVSELLANDWS